MSRTKFAHDDLARYLAAVDSLLEEPTEIIVVGSTSLILGYGLLDTTTEDIDTLRDVTDALHAALNEAAKQLGYRPHLHMAGIAQFPNGFEDRLVQYPVGEGQLTVFVPDRYDVVLSKTMRATDHDIQHIVSLHQIEPLDYDTLLARFRDDTLPDYFEDKAKELTDYFLWVIEALYGEMYVSRAKRALESIGRDEA